MSIKLEVTSQTADMSTIIELPQDATQIKPKLKAIATKRNEKYQISKASYDGMEISVKDYFKEFNTISEIKKGLTELEKDILNLENTDTDELLNFMVDYVDENDCKYLIQDYVTDVIESGGCADIVDDMLSSYNTDELWEYMDWSSQEELLSDYIDCMDLSEVYETIMDNEDMMECILAYTPFSLKEILEKMKGNEQDESGHL